MNQKAKKVCVITGRSSGMGFSTTKRMGKKDIFWCWQPIRPLN